MEFTQKKYLPLFREFVLANFPFLASDKDALELTQRVDFLLRYVDLMTSVINGIFDQKVLEYIDTRFNDIMMNAIYDESTETLTLSLEHTNS